MKKIKEIIKNKLIPSIPFLIRESSELRVKITLMENEMSELKGETLELKGEIAELKGEGSEFKKEMLELKNEVLELKKEIKITSEEILTKEREILFTSNVKEELAMESNWRTNGDDSLSIDKINESLHSPYLWRIYTANYWVICFSVLINRGYGAIVNKFIFRYINAHGYHLLDRYMVVSNFLKENRMPVTPKIEMSSFVFNELKKQKEKGTLINYFSNKKIAIVGNGPSEVGKGLGSTIDMYDVVIRFNNYKTDFFEKDYGSKTNVWVRGSGGDDIVERNDLSEYDMIILEADYEHFPICFDDLDSINRYIKEDGVECCNFDYESHLTLRMESGIDFPSTGLVAIWNIIKIAGIDNVGIFGFSFLEDNPSWVNNHYFNDRDDIESKERSTVHEMKREADFISKIYKNTNVHFKNKTSNIEI